MNCFLIKKRGRKFLAIFYPWFNALSIRVFNQKRVVEKKRTLIKYAF